jgi:hypothetical protein
VIRPTSPRSTRSARRTRIPSSPAGSAATVTSITNCGIAISAPDRWREPDQAPLAGAFGLAGRRYWIDVLASLALFAAAAVAAGRVWRFPFDDEIQTIGRLLPAEYRDSTWDYIRFFLDGLDIHPPLSFLVFVKLYGAGIGEPALRLISLTMTALALGLWHLIALALIDGRHDAVAGRASRLVAVLLFGLSPLAIGQGDAIRWYPMFALCVGMFAALYLAGGTFATRLASAVPLGVAVSVNLIAPLVLLPFVIYRYLLERAHRLAFDISYWLLFGVCAAPGLWTAMSLVRRNLVWREKFANSPFSAIATDALGFFGGCAVGVGRAWALSPLALVTVAAMLWLVDWRNKANPLNLCLLLLAMIVPSALAGFSEPRAFLYLAPVLALVLTSFFDRVARRAPSGALLVTCGALLPALVTIGELRGGSHPFKRNAAVPYGGIIDFIERNRSGDTLVISTDPVVPWELRKLADPRLCAGYFWDEPACLGQALPSGSLFVVSGYGNHAANRRQMKRFTARVAELAAGRTKIAELRAGHDEDAALKTRLTGVPLDEFILTIELYR